MRRRPGARFARGFVWFKRWIVEGYTVRQSCQQSGLSEWKLRCLIRYWLDHPPVDSRDLSRHRHVVVDGTFLYGRRVGAVVFVDAETNEVVAGIYGMQEGEAAMTGICCTLKSRGLNPVSATIDGNPQLYKMLQAVWPTVIIQRCLVHIYWQGRRWCRAKPKYPEARELRRLFSRVLRIHSRTDRDRFLAQWDAWEERHGQRIANARQRGWVISDIKSARSMLINAQPDMFRYLEHPEIPTNTNAAEGFFGRLKQRYAQHRGLAPYRRNAYFTWYFQLCK